MFWQMKKSRPDNWLNGLLTGVYKKGRFEPVIRAVMRLANRHQCAKALGGTTAEPIKKWSPALLYCQRWKLTRQFKCKIFFSIVSSLVGEVYFSLVPYLARTGCNYLFGSFTLFIPNSLANSKIQLSLKRAKMLQNKRSNLTIWQEFPVLLSSFISKRKIPV